MTKITAQHTKVPTLRFPGFLGEWEEKKMGKMTIINPKDGTLPKEFIYIDLESVVGGKLLKEQKVHQTEAPSRAQRLLRKNDILFQMVRPYQKNNYFFNKENTNYVASTGYAQIRFNGEPLYLYQYIHTQKFVDNVIEKCTGSNYPAINSTDLANINISFPTLPEQKKIADFLSYVDDKITSLSSLKSARESYKSGIMQQIFSKKIRFPGFTDEWEEKKLSSLLIFKVDNRGKTPPINTSGIPLIEVNAIGEKNINYSVIKKYVSQKTYNTWFRQYLKEGDILFSTVGITGLCSYYSEENIGCIAQNIVGLRFEKGSGCFMYYLLTFKPNNNKFQKIQMGAVQPSVKVSQMIHLRFGVPSLPEQIKIANFLSQIDQKIDEVSQQIEKAKEWKKGLLQGLFI